MRSGRLWQRLLGLERTVVEGVEFDEDADAVVVSVRSRKGAGQRCGRCGRRAPWYDRGHGCRRWQALELGTIITLLEADAPRVACPERGPTVVQVPWARHGAGHTRAFDDQVAWLATHTSKTAVVELMRVAWRTVGAIINPSRRPTDPAGGPVLLGGFQAAVVLHKEALVLAQELGGEDTVAHARNGLGLAARRQGHYGRARELHLEALSFFREAGFTEETAYSLACLGFVEELRGDLDAAEGFHRESLLLARELFDELPLALVLEGLACVAAERQQPQRAAVLLGAAESIRKRAGTPLPPRERVDVDRATDAAVSALGREAFTGVCERGRRMSIEEAAGYALSGGTAG